MISDEQLGRLRAVAARPGGVQAVSISCGANHVLSAHSPAVFASELRAMLRAVRSVVGKECVVVLSSLPPMRRR